MQAFIPWRCYPCLVGCEFGGQTVVVGNSELSVCRLNTPGGVARWLFTIV